MDLLLTHGYFLCEDPKELQIMKPYVPLGILYLASHLRARNFAVEVFDSTFSSLAELRRFLETEAPAVLGIYANLMTRRNVVRTLQFAKNAGWKTVVGGPEPATYVEQYLESGADVVVIGEGEVTLEELLPILKAGRSEELPGVAGIAFRGKDGVTHRTPPRAQIRDINGQPWPSRESVPIHRYLETWKRHHDRSSLSLITARGCPYECRWCSHAVYGKTHRRRMPSLVVDELESILHEYGPDMYWIADDVFTIHHGWLSDFAAEMRLRGIRVPFECISRADRVNAEVADLLAELGCFRIWIGSESGSQRILDAMHRGVTLDEVQSAVDECKSRGIQTGMFLMWGYEGEDLSDIEATIQHVRRTQPDIFLTTVAYPINGTPYFHDVADRIHQSESWAETSDREIRLQGMHSRGFYANADQLLKAEVELERLSRDPGTVDHFKVADLKGRIEIARAGLRTKFSETEV